MSQTCLNIQLNILMKLNSSKGQDHSLTLAKVHLDLNSSYESLWAKGNDNLYKWVWSQDQDVCHGHIWQKRLKFLFRQNQRAVALKRGV